MPRTQPSDLVAASEAETLANQLALPRACILLALEDKNVWYAGGESPLVGAIDVDFILGTEAPINSGLTNFVACADCRLNFVTGPRVASPLPALVFASGGGVWIEGTIPGAGISTPQILLAGEITGPPSFPSSFAFDLIPGALVTAGVFAVFRDVKNAALADYFGLPGGGGNRGPGFSGSGWQAWKTSRPVRSSPSAMLEEARTARSFTMCPFPSRTPGCRSSWRWARPACVASQSGYANEATYSE
jgi:hypothetical protein